MSAEKIKRFILLLAPDRWNIFFFLLVYLPFLGGYANLVKPHDSMGPTFPLEFLGRIFPFLSHYAWLLLIPIAPFAFAAQVLVDDHQLPHFIYSWRDFLGSILVASYLYPLVCFSRAAVKGYRAKSH